MRLFLAILGLGFATLQAKQSAKEPERDSPQEQDSSECHLGRPNMAYVEKLLGVPKFKRLMKGNEVRWYYDFATLDVSAVDFVSYIVLDETPTGWAKFFVVSFHASGLAEENLPELQAFRSPISIDQIRRLHDFMSADGVIKELGIPNRMLDRDRLQVWRYSAYNKSFNLRIGMELCFDRDRLVIYPYIPRRMLSETVQISSDSTTTITGSLNGSGILNSEQSDDQPPKLP